MHNFLVWKAKLAKIYIFLDDLDCNYSTICWKLPSRARQYRNFKEFDLYVDCKCTIGHLYVRKGDFQETFVNFLSTQAWEPSQWYFVTKIVLNLCEKKLLWWSRKTFENLGWRPRICKHFEITKNNSFKQ